MTTTAYTPPASLMEVLQKIDFEEALDAADQRYVPTEEARGSEQTYKRLARKLGWNAERNAFFPPASRHVLFFGHVGCGKTTELRQYARKLNQSKRYLVVEVDVVEKLDRNNLQYADVMVAMAERLLEELERVGAAAESVSILPLYQWFTTTLVERTEHRDFSAEIQTSVEAGGGLPGLLKLLGKFTTAFKTGATYKKQWREEIRNDFTKLVSYFNTLIQQAEEALKAAGRAERVVFMIDGTDKLNKDDGENFFVWDAEQLLLIQTLVIYTAPLELKYSGRLAVSKLDADIMLPMIKLYEPNGQRWEPGWTVLAQMLLRRVDRHLFSPGPEGDVQIAKLVEYCGGHPRDLLRLLRVCCEMADDLIDAPTVERAIKQLAADYRLSLQPSDYDLLVSVDAQPEHLGNDKATQALLHDRALLQYNDGSWRRSHPVVRTLEGYQAALRRAKAAVAPPVP